LTLARIEDEGDVSFRVADCCLEHLERLAANAQGSLKARRNPISSRTGTGSLDLLKTSVKMRFRLKTSG